MMIIKKSCLLKFRALYSNYLVSKSEIGFLAAVDGVRCRCAIDQQKKIKNQIKKK